MAYLKDQMVEPQRSYDDCYTNGTLNDDNVVFLGHPDDIELKWPSTRRVSYVLNKGDFPCIILRNPNWEGRLFGRFIGAFPAFTNELDDLCGREFQVDPRHIQRGTAARAFEFEICRFELSISVKLGTTHPK